ncbi:TraB/GumN family protein [Oleiagrimonas sp. C23AA]|uniref:TraB/GumN family protein n=1 Tax=Oleiagrimonas sp. C23AA TaxID=2719047 RepID=UPI00141E1D10|nr:TraB/GumN family protein [Oleiagrimonas sp. C23AA]NII09396.1 TraB/GumN family protein [Oleiagrimonas sp. C23AA]
MTELSTDTPPDVLDSQPIEHVRRDGVEYVVLGTAHVSRSSMEAVQAILERESFDAVAVELCESRAQGMRDPEAFKRMDLFQVIRQGKTGMVAASLILSSFQRRLAEQHGIEPGAEMQAGMSGAEAQQLPLWLVDREVGTTLKRAWRNVGFREKMGILGGLVGSLFEREDIGEDDIEQLKQGDMLEGAFREFASSSQSLYQALIAERDSYMAARLRQEASQAPEVRRVLVIVGAGHMKGLIGHLRDTDIEPATEVSQLSATPKGTPWFKWMAMALVLAVFGVIIYAFHKNPALGTDALRDWVLYTGGLAALGALLGGGHLLTALTSFVAAPLKPFRPGIPAGAVGALTEVWLRKPKVADFEALRHDITEWKGWWRNRVARVFVIFTLVNIGTIIGEYAAGIHIVRSLF